MLMQAGRNDAADTVEKMAHYEEVFWENPCCEQRGEDVGLDTEGAEKRLQRFAPYIRTVFPETDNGIIESPLIDISKMKERLFPVKGRLLLKEDSDLPISGSVKARGGIYEVLKTAETIAVRNGMLSEEDDYAVMADQRFRELFSQYKVAVGSTGNLGLSIGIAGAAMGFKTVVHMSSDAREWKKELLREKGAVVREHDGDYEEAVAQGRMEAAEDRMCHFVDDENSTDLLEGYSTAGPRLKKQLDDMGIRTDREHKLYVYIPCGVGGAPAGIAYGLRKAFGENVHVYFAEPTHAPCMTLGLITGLGRDISVRDIGIDGITEADGLAVCRPSAPATDAARYTVSGCFTVGDRKLYRYMRMLKESEDIFAEPSACAAFDGLRYTSDADETSVHVVWSTGGSMMPRREREAFLEKGKEEYRG